MDKTNLDIVMRNNDFVIYAYEKPMKTPLGNELAHTNARLLRQAVTQQMMGILNPFSTINLLSKLIDTKPEDILISEQEVTSDILINQGNNSNWLENNIILNQSPLLIDYVFLNASSLHSALKNVLLDNDQNLHNTEFYKHCITELTNEQKTVINTLKTEHETGIMLPYLLVKKFLTVTEYAAGNIILQIKANKLNKLHLNETNGIETIATNHKRIVEDALIALDFLALYNNKNQISVIEEIILRGEDNKTEFKSSLRWDIHQDKKNPAIEHAALKTICAFLNSEGGDLLIGVRDDSSIEGIETDKLDNDDRFLLHIWTLIKTCMGQEVVEWVKTSLQKFGGKTVCRVHCQKGQKPIFLRQKGFDEALYIRVGPSSSSLEISSALKYIEQHF